jgi:hypothetical protein
VACVAMAGCDGSSPREHRSESGNFSVQMAGSPEASVDTIVTEFGPLELHLLSKEMRNGSSYSVGWMDYPKASIRRDNVERYLDDYVKLGSAGLSGVIRRWDQIRLGDHPGRDLWVDIHNPISPRQGLGRLRFYFVGERLYQLFALDPDSSERPEPLDAFVKSFQLLKDVPGLPNGPGPGTADHPEPAPR